MRTALSLGRLGSKWAAYFGDQSGQAYAVDAANGELIWKTRVESYPGASVDRRTRAISGPLIRAGVVRGRNIGRRFRLRVLQVSWEPFSVGRRHRQSDLEELYHPG